MFLTLLILLPNLIFADEACELATKLADLVQNADTVDKVLASYSNPFEHSDCDRPNTTVHITEHNRKGVETFLKSQNPPSSDVVMSTRQIKDCKLDAVSKDLEFTAIYPNRNNTVEYQAKLVGDNYKITSQKVMDNGRIC